MRLLLIFLVLGLPLFALQGAAAKIIHVPADSSTIQGGINGAAGGDTVLVARGHYYERINFYGKKILVASNFVLDSLQTTIDSTIIDADTLILGVSDTGSVVVFVCGEDTTSVITGFTIQKGIGTFGEYHYRWGGGIYCANSWPTINNNTIIGNSTLIGGGICCWISSSPTIRNNTIAGNSAQSWGGGILCWEDSSTISHNTISGNSANGGGGIFLKKSSPVIMNNTISGNSANEGGAIYCSDHDSFMIKNNTITTNFALYSGGGIFCSNFSYTFISNNTISDNSASSGGGIMCHESSTIISNNRITGNSAAFGGGIYCGRDCMSAISNNTINGNSASSGGGGIDCDWNASPVITNNIISNSPDGEGIHSIDEAWPTISYNDVWNNADGNFWGGQPGVGDTTWGKNFNFIPCDSFHNIIRDPLFADTMSYALLCSSACIDAGDPSFQVPDSGGRRIDIGVYEYPYIVGDANQDKQVSLSDVVYMINCIFLSGPCPCPPGKGDVDCNRFEDIVDIVYLINYLFKNGPEPGCL